MKSSVFDRAAREYYNANLRAVREAQPIVSQSAAAAVRCPAHGKHQVARFVAGRGVLAQYVCELCWDELTISGAASACGTTGV